MVLSYPVGIPNHFISDPGRVRQIFMNLVSNAIKFTDTGYIFVEVSDAFAKDATSRRGSEKESDETLRGAPDAAPGLRDFVGTAGSKFEIRVSVHDTGIGIPEDKVELLFNRFSQVDVSHTRKYCGTSLGLAICKQLVELLGGQISVATMPGHGSTFSVALPLTLAPELEEPAAEQAALLKDIRCLVIDSHAMSRFVTTDLCAARGLRAREAQSLDEASEKIDKTRTIGEPYAVVIVDCPAHGMDPEEAVSRIRSLDGCQELPIILLVPINRHRSASAPSLANLETRLTKPVRPTALLAALKSVLLAQAPAAQPVGPPLSVIQPESQPLSGKRILVVEDNIMNQKVTAAQLRRMGCVVEVATNGREGVQMSSLANFDVIIMDCQMPEMDGFAATRKIRSREGAGKRTPIVALTAGVSEADQEKCIAAGMDEFLAKPTNSSRLLEVIRKLTRSQTRGAAQSRLNLRPVTTEIKIILGRHRRHYRRVWQNHFLLRRFLIALR